jgi:thiol-disulfide isomerase/thioredoxin
VHHFIKHRADMLIKTLTIAAAIGLAALTLMPGAEAPTVLSQLKGKLVALSGNITIPENDSAVGDPKYFALYFGAGWCGPCHKFTPDLVSFYKEMKPKHPEFEVVFMSRDTSAPEMQRYMAEMHMPWPALRYDAVKWTAQLNHLCGPGIPCLVLVDGHGQIVSDSFEGAKYLGPQKVLTDLRKLLEQGVPPTMPAFGAASPSPSPTGTPLSPSGTEWDKIFKKKTP